ncbi:hypothetical protein ACFLU6_07920 [Acidobacteriota bacterium]
MTDHNYMLTIAEYREGLRQAADSSVQGEFAAIYGMMWCSFYYNVKSMTSCDGEF